MRGLTFDQFVKRSNPPVHGNREPFRLTCGCGVTAADEFGNRDLEPNPDCPLHGEADA